LKTENYFTARNSLTSLRSTHSTWRSQFWKY